MDKKNKESILFKMLYICLNTILLLLGISMLTVKNMDFEGYILIALSLLTPIVFVFTKVNKKLDDKKKRKISILIVVLEIIIINLWCLWLVWPSIENPICSQWDNPSCWSKTNK